MSIGNQAVLDMADYVDAVADDPRVSAIVLYIEGLKDVRAFAAAAAKAFTKGIPIVALKAGLSETGRRIALSHTGSMAGAPELYQALFDRLGIISVNSFSELLETVKVVALGEPPAGNRLSIETCSGTDSGYCADLADRFGVDLPQPDATVKEALRRVIPDIATPMNPIDVTMAQWADRDAQATSLLTLLQQPTDAAALIINFPQGAWRESYVPAIDAMVDVSGKTGLPCYVISNLAEGLPKDVRDRLIAHRIVPLQGIEDAFASLGRVARYVKQWETMRAAGGPVAALLGGTGVVGDVRACDEWASKAWLREAGIAVPDGRYVATVDAAVAAAEEIGYPVVLKGAGPSLQHKSELGAVALGLPDGQAVRDIAEAMAKDIAGVEGFIVEAMVRDAIAEVIVGAKRDDLFGVSLLIGAGGIFTELMRDVRNLLLPVTREEVRSAVDSLKIAPLLHGFRGRPPGDVEALVDAIVAIARHVEKDAARLSELDVNPLMVRAVGLGVVAVDALLTVIEPSS
jgi:acyl-CoA synthetase (NDP forming)